MAVDGRWGVGLLESALRARAAQGSVCQGVCVCQHCFHTFAGGVGSVSNTGINHLPLGRWHRCPGPGSDPFLATRGGPAAGPSACRWPLCVPLAWFSHGRRCWLPLGARAPAFGTPLPWRQPGVLEARCCRGGLCRRPWVTVASPCFFSPETGDLRPR